MTEPTKVCAGCKERKPFSQFHAQTRWPDGTTRQPRFQCKACERLRVARRARERWWADPVTERAKHRELQARLAQDPEWRERRREASRRSRRKVRDTPVDRWLVLDPPALDKEGFARLPIAPFRAFLLDLLQREHDGVQGELAMRCGVSDRRVWGWLRSNNAFVKLDAADAVLCRLGVPHLMEQFWPELYQFDEAVA